jgi:adenylosuccinate lyase
MSKSKKAVESVVAPRKRTAYESPLVGRYGDSEMSYIFSPQFKFSTWRKLWVALADAERMLGLPITEKQVRQLSKFVDQVNFDVADEREKQIRHDVMAHVYAYGQQAPDAKGIIHLGATSAYVTDNTDLIQIRSALEMVSRKIVNVIAALAKFAEEHASLPTLAYTHFQAAQPTTVGKRACLWIQELLLDLEDVQNVYKGLPFLGVKGTTGTQASFLELFNGDMKKVLRLEHLVAETMGFSRVLAVSGQTYTRKLDYRALSVLSGVAQSAHKFANDLRLLAHLKEIEEPFEAEQVGSSAMAYKRNPMRAERMTGLARHVMVLAMNPALTSAEQWFERTLDDSSNKRISIPEAFLTIDIVLETWLNIAQNMVVYSAVIAAHLSAEMPFMASENLMMEAVKHGGDRQELHEQIRTHSQEAARQVKQFGKPNDLLERIAQDPAFKSVHGQLDTIMDPQRYIGLAAEQTKDFLRTQVRPILRTHRAWLGMEGKVSV